MPLSAHWLTAFQQVITRCNITADEQVVVLAEHASRSVLIELAELTLGLCGCRYFRVVVPTPLAAAGPLVCSTGASLALDDQPEAVAALCNADVVIDLTLEGLMHAKQTAAILQSGTRILTISNEHPDILCRLLPEESLMTRVKQSVKRLRSAQQMTVVSDAGTDVSVSLQDARTVGVWGWTDRPGTLAHWPGGLVVSFPAKHSVNGQIVLAPGDLNLSFKRYIESPVTLKITNDYVTDILGDGADAAMMRRYLADFGDKDAYATSHVGWGLNPAARYESMLLHNRENLNGTELRAVAGNFLYSTGANEFAGRFTRGHFDLPVMNCTITLDGDVVVDRGTPVS